MSTVTENATAGDVYVPNDSPPVGRFSARAGRGSEMARPRGVTGWMMFEGDRVVIDEQEKALAEARNPATTDMTRAGIETLADQPCLHSMCAGRQACATLEMPNDALCGPCVARAAMAEIERLRATAHTFDWERQWNAEWATAAMKRCERLECELQRLRKLCAEVGRSGVELDDARMQYVTIQIDRATWGELRAAAEGK